MHCGNLKREIKKKNEPNGSFGQKRNPNSQKISSRGPGTLMDISLFVAIFVVHKKKLVAFRIFRGLLLVYFFLKKYFGLETFVLNLSFLVV